jgi:hypothetical protein
MTLPDTAQQGIDAAHVWFSRARDARADASAYDAVAAAITPRPEMGTLAGTYAARQQAGYRALAQSCREVADHADQVGLELQSRALRAVL